MTEEQRQKVQKMNENNKRFAQAADDWRSFSLGMMILGIIFVVGFIIMQFV